MQSTSSQLDHIMLKLPCIDNYEDSCDKIMLPSLLIDNEYTLEQEGSPITHGIKEIDKMCTDMVVRKKMRSRAKEYVTSPKVIIDDLLLHSSSLSLLMLLFECY